jgi:hypothetical protein
VKFNVCWDNNDATLQALVSKIKARLEEAPTKTTKILNVDSPMEGIVTGQ